MSGMLVIMHHSCIDDWLYPFSPTNMHKDGKNFIMGHVDFIIHVPEDLVHHVFMNVRFVLGQYGSCYLHVVGYCMVHVIYMLWDIGMKLS